MNNLNIPLYRGFSKTFNKYILGIPYFSDGRYYMLVDDCKNKKDGTYQEICSNCKRFYGCYFEAKEV